MTEARDPSRYPVGLGAQFRRNLPLYLSGAALLAAQQLLMAKRDFLVKEAVDAAVLGTAGAAQRAAVLMLAVSIGAALMRVLSRVTIFTGGRNVEYELRAILLSRLHKLGPAFFRRMPTGEIMSRATNDLTQVRLLLGFGILNVVGSIFALASALYVMIHLSGKLTLAALGTMPILMLITRSFSSKLFLRTRENQEALGQMSDRVLASLAGVRVVRSFALEGAETEAFAAANKEYLEKSLGLARLRGSMGPIMGGISAVGVLVVFLYGGRLVLSGEMTRGDFVSFWLALLRLTWPMLAIGFVAAIVQRGRAGYARLKAIFDAVPEVVSGPLPRPEVVRGALSVRDLSFAYGERKVVDGVSFDVPAGGSLAIVGRTGSGKSTIAILLARLLPTPRGAVLLDGQDICDLPLETVRELGLARARLKWPNDVVVDRDGGTFAKLAGVLVETRGLDPAAPHYVVGVGLNVAQTEFPAELTASRAVTSLRLEGSAATLESAQERLIGRLAHWLERDRLTTDALAGPFLDAARLRDAEVEVETETTLRGRVLGLSLERGLELALAGRRASIALEHLRQVRPL
ncbi:MAG: ATP-binding cassette domain-containing protein [Planctomycetaceae bacterium]|nr:ATP-binding cassette domain-containing protein [Planctomycetaceae bacterium]